MKTLLSSILLFALLFASSCKDENPYTIPYVVVYKTVYPNGIDSDLGVGMFKYFSNVGYRGIVVYNKGFGEFVAYERACTYDTEKPTAVVAVDASGIFAVCPVCKSKYNILLDGYPFEGPAKNPLIKYPTTYDGYNVVVHN